MEGFLISIILDYWWCILPFLAALVIYCVRNLDELFDVNLLMHIDEWKIIWKFICKVWNFMTFKFITPPDEKKKIKLQKQMNKASELCDKLSAIIDGKLENEKLLEQSKEVNDALIQYSKLLESIRKDTKQPSSLIVKANAFYSTRLLFNLITWGNFLLFLLYHWNEYVAFYYTSNCIVYNSLGSVKCRLCAYVINLCQNDLADFIYKVWVSLFSNLISMIHNPL
jgi:hypothetical protein